MRKIEGRRLRSRTSAGFTLVEISIAIVIIGILVAIATVGFVRYRRRAKMAEATNLVSAIKAEQHAYRTERGVYASVSNSVDSFYPAATPGNFKTEWGGPCSTCLDPHAWERLPIKPPEPVMYGYATVAGVGDDLKTTPKALPPPGGLADPSSSSSGGEPDSPAKVSNDCATIEPTEPYFVIKAQGDTDGDGTSATVLALSCSNALILTNEGE